EKSLQLSRIEQDASLTLTPVSLERYLKRQEQKLLSSLQLRLEVSQEAQEILADELALNMIFRKLFENTLRHHPHPQRIEITARRNGEWVELSYDDHGQKFKGDLEHLGNLFYKFNSAKGSGIGLYLIKQLMR